RQKGDLKGAEELYLRALAVREAKREPDHRDLVATLTNVGRLYSEWERHDKAGEALERAQSLVESRGGPADELSCHVLDALADHCEDIGHQARAIELRRRALAVREDLLGPSHPNLAAELSHLAGTLLKANVDRAEAESMLGRALSILDGDGGGKHPFVLV